MQNRFGIKDFILMVMVAIVGVIVLMDMFVKDRNWVGLTELDARVKSVESAAGRISADVERVSAFIEAGGTLSGSGNARRGDERPGWAVPDVKIDWQPPFALNHDPAHDPGFQTGGVFVECFEAQLSKLTSYVAEDTYGRRIEDFVVEKLAVYDPETLKVKGVLAEAWQYDPDGMWLRVKIRDRARFSDGEPVTAEDVAYTFNDFIMNPLLETESIRSIVAPYLDRVEVVSEKVAVFHYKQPGAYNLDFSLVDGVLPKHFFEKFTPQQINENPALLMGSGPYKLATTSWVPGEDIVIERNEQYWGPKPPLDEMRFRVVEREEPRLQAMINGEVDMILPGSTQFKDFQDNPEKAAQFNIDLHRWINMRSGYGFIGWQCGERNGKLTPFQDKRVRQAMTLLLDRELMIQDIWVGNGFVAVGPNNGPVPTVPKDAKPWPYDMDRAKALLAEAGWKDNDGDGILENEAGQPFRFEYTRPTGGATAERMQDYIVKQCGLVGIVCEPKVVEWAQYDQIMKTRDFDAITLGWSASAPESDPSQIWHTDSIRNQGHNFVQWDGGQDKYIEAIRTERDFDRRMEAWHQFHNLVHDEQPYSFIRALPWTRLIDGQFTNFHEYASGLEPREFMFTGHE